MSNQYFNFYYSPTRQGFDSSSWRALIGAPISSGGRLLLTGASMIHYGDILRGDATFNVNIAAPGPGLSKKFGFYQPNKNAYAYFYINGASLTAETSDGVNTTSVSITWQSAWTNTNTDFRVKWEAGMATFYVGGIQQAITSNISVTGFPMSLYVANESQDTLILNYIDVQSIQSYMMSEANEDAVFAEKYVYIASGITITEAVTMFYTIQNINGLTGVSDGLTLSESVTISIFYPISVSDSLTVTDVRTVGAPA